MADRFTTERAKWDSHARDPKSGSFKPLPPEADFAWYCAKDPLMVGMAEHLGDLHGRRVLEYAVGKAVLHHLAPEPAASELHRVLVSGGVAAFSEPLGSNPLVKFVRDHVPYPYKHERGADIPLRRSDIRAWTRPFAVADLRGIQLLSMLERAFGFGHQFALLRRIDTRLLKRWPSLWPLCRYGVLTLTK